MTKKLLLLFIICVFLLSGCVAHEETASEIEESAPISAVPEPEPQPEPVSISITAVGDCTLASDVHFMGKDSFVYTYNREDTDSSYFLANVKHLFGK